MQAEGSELSKPDAAEECRTIRSFGRGEDAVTVLVCFGPRGERLPFKSGEWTFKSDEGPFKNGEFPFEDGWLFDRGAAPLGRDGRPFGGGLPFDFRDLFGGGLPFDFEGPDFRGLFEGGLPFGSEGPDFRGLFEGGLPFDFEDLFEDLGDGDRGFRFRPDGGDGSDDGFCFRQGDGSECFSDLDQLQDQLSDEEREQIDRMMELLDGLGLGSFSEGLEGFLGGLDLEFPESSTDPSGATGS